jgi:hypothetical protein
MSGTKTPAWQTERNNNYQQKTVIAIPMEVVTYQQHLDTFAPNWEEDETPERAINAFEEDLDLIIQPALIGNARKSFERNRYNNGGGFNSRYDRPNNENEQERTRSPFIIDGAITYKRFQYKNWKQIIERIVTQRGFAESQNIFFAKRGSGSFGSQASQLATDEQLQEIVGKFQRKGKA